MRTTAAAIALIREEEGHAALRHIGSLRERDRVESASHREDKRSGHVRHMLPARAALSLTVSVQRVRYKVGNRSTRQGPPGAAGAQTARAIRLAYSYSSRKALYDPYGYESLTLSLTEKKYYFLL